jgi:L-alanine-DL-glutamate epimerase-like enolase superfamily enzyme
MSDAFPNDEPRLSLVEAIHVRVPFRRPLLDASGEYTHRRSWLLRIVDESGNQGLGEAALDPFAEEVTTASLAALMREIAPGLAAGRLPVWADLAAEGEPGRAAMAAVDGALASLRAARTAASGLTAGAATSGGSVAVGAVIAFGGPDAGADAAEQAVRLGFETLKIRAGFERTTDQLVDRVRAIRAAVGPGPRLRIDVAGAWDLDTAAERMQALESFRIEFVEQPLPAWDTIRHATLRERTRVPVALDESIDSEGAARAALADGAADVIVVKPARVGGPAATLRIGRWDSGRLACGVGSRRSSPPGRNGAVPRRGHGRCPRPRSTGHATPHRQGQDGGADLVGPRRGRGREVCDRAVRHVRPERLAAGGGTTEIGRATRSDWPCHGARLAASRHAIGTPAAAGLGPAFGPYYPAQVRCIIAI